jgi:DNA repair protein RecO (recombination protein O)
LMGALISGTWSSADGSESKVQREVSGVVAAYLQFHLERSLRSLPLVERV